MSSMLRCGSAGDPLERPTDLAMRRTLLRCHVAVSTQTFLSLCVFRSHRERLLCVDVLLWSPQAGLRSCSRRRHRPALFLRMDNYGPWCARTDGAPAMLNSVCVCACVRVHVCECGSALSSALQLLRVDADVGRVSRSSGFNRDVGNLIQSASNTFGSTCISLSLSSTWSNHSTWGNLSHRRFKRGCSTGSSDSNQPITFHVVGSSGSQTAAKLRVDLEAGSHSLYHVP